MSWQAVTWVLEQSQSVLGSRLVLISIASHANREGHNAWPSVDTLCLEARLTRREVQYCLRQLEELGELTTHIGGGRGRSNHYSMPFVEDWLTAQNLRSLEKRKQRNEAPKGRNLRQETAHPIAQEPFRTVKEEPSEEKTQENFVPVLSEPSKPEALSESEANTIRFRKNLRVIGKQHQVPRMSAQEIEQRRQFLLKQADQIKRSYQ